MEVDEKVPVHAHETGLKAEHSHQEVLGLRTYGDDEDHDHEPKVRALTSTALPTSLLMRG